VDHTGVDAVVVTYNSRDRIRACLQPLVDADDVEVYVVDNASNDGTLDVLSNMDAHPIANPRNGGFAYGCNRGWRAGRAPYVLFLNPDARISAAAVRTLARTLDANADVGAVGPKIVEEDGALDFSRRRFPSLRSTYAQALFLHRVFPSHRWSDEMERDPAAHEREGAAEWISGACVMTRRSLLERLDGLDETFFLYCEDKDLCRRIWDASFEVRFVPDAVAVHAGGASAPRAMLLPVLAESRVKYARKHSGPIRALLERIGVGLGHLTHAVAGRGGLEWRLGHVRAFAHIARPLR
jgi:GT2 family glycosyltransferase